MSVFENPLFYFAVGFVGMLIAAWLFDRASATYISLPHEERTSAPPSVVRIAARAVAGGALALAVLFGLYRTTLLFADVLLIVALVAFAIGAYRVRLRPLLAAGIPAQHLAVLVGSLALWVLPMLWFAHLHLANSYGGAQQFVQGHAASRHPLTQASSHMRSAVALFLCLLLGGCSSAPEEAIAVLFEHRDFRLGRYCLDVQGNDPTPELLVKIRQFNAHVFPASQCHRVNSGYRTGDGLETRMLRIAQIQRMSPTVVTFEVIDDTGFLLGSSGSTYTVEKLLGFWVVTNSDLDWLS